MTPAFIVLDYVGGINVRIAALDTMPSHKNFYYGFCIVCGLLAFFQPRVSMIVAIFESSIIILITLRSLLMPVLAVIGGASDISGDWSLIEAFDLELAINLVIAGTIGVVALRTNVKALTGRDVLKRPLD
jgi:hypothetical protein